MIIDLRSDTVTVPDEGMLRAMMNARVGDDVFGEDPTVNKLEVMVAEFFGFENALFVPSGTMANQIALKLHTEAGDELLCDENSHVYHYETGGAASNSGVQIKPLKGNQGILSLETIKENVLPFYDWYARTRLVWLENTNNRAGGTYYKQKEIEEIFQYCIGNDLKMHIDGARIWNALAATDENPKLLGKISHTLSVCLSKGLGCPVGSLLLGSSDDIKKARRIRKAFGGGMRQAGYLAAAGVYAIQNNLPKLKDDHRRAKEIYECLKALDWVKEINEPQTNILIFTVKDEIKTDTILEKMKENGILISMMDAKRLRMVTHLQIIDEAISQLKIRLKKNGLSK
jgi:threonine aldolase